MGASKERRVLIRAGERGEEFSYRHPLNPNAEIRGVTLSGQAGLSRIGFHLVRIPPGKEANMFHTHAVEEEFYFVLEGRGVIEIGDKEHEVGPGDFMGFAAPAEEGHLLKNPFDAELVYLVGGERSAVEFAGFPRLGKRVIRIRGEAHTVDEEDLEPFWKADG